MGYHFLAELDSRPLLGDGAMGTTIYAKGIPFERCFDELNTSNPALIGEIHQSYIQAGSNIIQTNTFGANRVKLAEHGLADSVTAINRAGVSLARRVVDASFKEVFIAATVGPSGMQLAPLGRLSAGKAYTIFHEQVSALVEAGADLLMFDTFADVAELEQAVKAARAVSSEIPIVLQVTFTEDGRTPLGMTSTKVAAQLAELPVDVIGLNCSMGPSGVLRTIRQLSELLPAGTRLSAQPNAGWPERVGGRIIYPATPEYFGDYALAFVEAGVRLVGGCCGTTPEHIAYMRAALDDPSRQASPLLRVTREAETSSGPANVLEPTRLAHRLETGEFVVTAEISPPKGVFVEEVLAGVATLKAAGANMINVADSPRARMRMSPWAMCYLIQNRLDLETVLHFPIRGRNILRVQGDLLAAHALNVRNVFAVMGDPTSIGEYPEATDAYDVVPTGLIKLLKQGLNQGVDHGGEPLAQPTRFTVGCALNLTPGDPERELKVLRKKIENGADFALTQPVYNVAEAQAFIARYESEFGPWPLAIIAGVLPLYNGRHADFLHNEVPGINIPDELRSQMKEAGKNGAEVGVGLARDLVMQLRPFVQGIYLIPAFGRYDLAAEVIEVVSEEAAPV
ncbi:MAG: bifunctional homocysteine S-methyltransferase/methylenetetrahydrofolate reductase [Anaerolineae bacterium]|nr:bifunctional homocysteine S-methyltransferase/methylenetetrahydrofolate reductase [Anaerolineae bacterium]